MPHLAWYLWLIIGLAYLGIGKLFADFICEISGEYDLTALVVWALWPIVMVINLIAFVCMMFGFFVASLLSRNEAEG